MRFLSASLLSAALLFGASANTSASDADGNYAVIGAGAQSCAAFRQAAADQGAQLLSFVSWLQGYLTYLNRSTEETFDAVPVNEPAALATLVLRVCAQDDTQTFETATIRTINVFAPLRVKIESPLVQISWNGQQLTVRQETIKTVQSLLQEKGFYDSAVDGTFGPKTAEAIIAFQKSKELPETGLPDGVTLAGLLLE